MGDKDLALLMEELVDVAPKWRKFGLQLKLSPSFLNGLMSNKDDQLYDVLMEWLRTAITPPATWAMIVAALSTRSVGEAKLAKELEKKYVHSGELLSCIDYL